MAKHQAGVLSAAIWRKLTALDQEVQTSNSIVGGKQSSICQFACYSGAITATAAAVASDQICHIGCKHRQRLTLRLRRWMPCADEIYAGKCLIISATILRAIYL